MLKKQKGNVTFHYRADYMSTEFETSNLREMIRWLERLPESRYPGSVTIKSERGVFSDIYVAELAGPETAAHAVVKEVKRMMTDICAKYGTPNAVINMEDDASDMDLIIFIDDDKFPNVVTFSSIEDINNVNHPMVLYLFVLFKEIVGEPIGRSC